MLEIHYTVNNNAEYVKTYEKASDFVAAQYKEVPDLQDNYTIVKVLLDGNELSLKEKTVGGLFDYLNN